MGQVGQDYTCYAAHCSSLGHARQVVQFIVPRRMSPISGEVAVTRVRYLQVGCPPERSRKTLLRRVRLHFARKVRGLSLERYPFSNPSTLRIRRILVYQRNTEGAAFTDAKA